MEKKRVLVVDDEQIICELLSKLLSKIGYDVIVAENGQDAVEKFSQNPTDIDLAIIDLSMPDMNGLETLSKLKSIDENITVLLSSGQDDTITSVMGEDNPADGFLVKPYRVNQLEEAIRNAGLKRTEE